MISVQNRRQLLNGSKYLLLFIWVILASCNIIKSNPVPPSGSPEGNQPKHSNKTEKAEPNLGKKKKISTAPEKQLVFFKGKEYLVPAKKEQFRIALILPFHLGYKTRVQKRTADIMMDYYKGLRLALDELEAMGLKADITIYDNKNDSNELKRILRKREIYKMDLVIGPIQYNQVKIVSRILKPYKIPVFSPFTAINALSDTNPLCYSFLPGHQLKARKLVSYLEKHHEGEKLIILRDGKRYDKSFVPYLIKELEKSGKVPYVKEAYKSHIQWNKLLNKKKKNVVYIASKQQNTVQNCIGGLIASKEDITVFGENNWTDFRDNDYMFWENLNMHILANSFEQKDDTLLLDLRLRYRETYSEDPSEYALRAYDQISFLGDVLMAFGEHFPMFIKENTYSYHCTHFQFITYNGCQQNAGLTILKYQDHQLQLVE